MSKRKNTTDRLFGERLRQFEAAPPGQVWHGISDALAEDQRKNRVLWIGRIAASVAVLLAVGTLWLLLRESPQTDLTTQEATETEVLATQKAAETEVLDTQADESRERLESAGQAVAEMGKPMGLDAVIPEGTKAAMIEVTGELTATYYLEPIQPMPGTGLETTFREPRTLMAMQFYPSVIPDASEGIDVFEEWGEEVQEGHDKWGVGTQVSPVYSYRNLEASGGTSATSSYYDKVETGIVTYAGGVNVHYVPLKRLSLQSGLYYSRMGMKVGNAYYTQINDRSFMDERMPIQASINNSTGTIETQQGLDYAVTANELPQSWELASSTTNANTLENAEGEILQNFEYLELPVILRYRVVDRRLGFHLLGGLSSNFLVGSKAYYQEGENKEEIGATANLRPVNYSSVVGVGVDYSITKKFHINLEPTFRYYLNSINIGSQIKSYPYTIGFYTGLLYTF